LAGREGAGMIIRFFRLLAIGLLAPALAGCGSDLLWWPSFGGPAFYVKDLPVAKVAHEVQCEIQDFLTHENDPKQVGGHPLLDPAKGATVTLNLQTEVSGSVTYLGIDLNKLGLGTIAQLVSSSNSVPTLQGKVQIKPTVSAQVVFVVPQAAGNIPAGPSPKKEPKVDLSAVSCHKIPDAITDWYHSVSLDTWLESYRQMIMKEEANHPNGLENVCQTQITLKTQFQILFDVSAGSNAFFTTPPVVLPIAGLNFDASPDFTHSLQIVLNLKPSPKHEELCKRLKLTQPVTPLP